VVIIAPVVSGPVTEKTVKPVAALRLDAPAVAPQKVPATLALSRELFRALDGGVDTVAQILRVGAATALDTACVGAALDGAPRSPALSRRERSARRSTRSAGRQRRR
jgi:hypothetical protein